MIILSCDKFGRIDFQEPFASYYDLGILWKTQTSLAQLGTVQLQVDKKKKKIEHVNKFLTPSLVETELHWVW